MIIFDVEPFERAGPYRFGMTDAEVLAVGHEPLRKKLTPRQEPDWRFGSYSMRFGARDGGLCEIGFSKQCTVKLYDIEVFSDSNAFERILQKDSQVYEFYGFLVFFGLGITLTGFHDSSESDKAMTVFRRGYWDEKLKEPKFRKWG